MTLLHRQSSTQVGIAFWGLLEVDQSGRYGCVFTVKLHQAVVDHFARLAPVAGHARLKVA